MGRICDYLSGKTIFLTGATGFLGQPLVEKILWAAPEIRRIYVLIRPKNLSPRHTQTAQQRIQKELFQSSAFDRLFSRHGEGIEEFLSDKLIAVSGDISQDQLGLDEENQSLLRREVDIVINSAAVVSFDAPLDEALELNVFGARRLAQFANSCPRAILLHVSTAYVCGTTDQPTPETLYHAATDDTADFPDRAFRDTRAEIEEIQSRIRKVVEASQSEEIDRQLKKTILDRSRKGRRPRRSRRQDIIDKLRRQWRREKLTEEGMHWARERGWNDTYTYTKALGERLVVAEREGRPTAIVRPSVIESSLSEPSPGWLDGLRMADPLIAAIGKGRLRSLPLNPDVVLDLVPVDMVVNATLATIPEVATKGGLRIYQVATGTRNPILLGTLYDLIYEYFVRNPMLDRAGKPIRIKRLKYRTPAQFRLQHKLRKVPLESAERTLDRLTVSNKAQKIRRRISATRVANDKLYYYGEIYEPYLNLNCRFQVDRTLKLLESLDEQEQQLFNFDLSRLNWRHYIQNVHIPGVKKYILKVEGAGTLEVMNRSEGERLETQTIPHLLERAALRVPEKMAFQIKREGVWEHLTYGELLQKVREVGRRFQAYGFKKGDRVVLYSENQPEWGIAYLGACQAGLVIVPIDSQTWNEEAWSVARFTQARAFLLSNACAKRLLRSGGEENETAESPTVLLNVNDACRPFRMDNLPASTTVEEKLPSDDKVVIEPDDPVSIIFTTSTAVDPRGAVHTHRNFITNLLGVHHYLPIFESDQLLNVLPLYHALAFTCGFLMPIYGGAGVSFSHSLKPRVLLETMRETGTTCLLGVPTLFQLIRDDVDRRVLKTSKSKVKSNLVATSKQFSRSVERRFGANIGRALFSRIHQEFGGRIRVVVSGGSALSEEIYDDYLAIGIPIYEGYGLTETAPVLTVSPLNRSRAGSAGKALPGIEIRLSNTDGEGIGEIIARTPSLMRGYYNNESATEKVIQGDWFYTGDLGWVDADGYVYITGRTKDVIVTGAGKNVYPIDLEATYQKLPEVKEICVLGIKSGLTEEVHSLIVPDTAIVQAPDEASIKKAVQKSVHQLARQLPSYNRLQAIHISKEPLPRDQTGVLDRALIREKILNLVAGRVDRTAPSAKRGKGTPDRVLIVDELSRMTGVAVDEIEDDSDLYSDLGMDSLMAIEFLLFLDQRFNAGIPDTEASQIHTVGQILSQIEKRRTVAEDQPPRAPKSQISSANPFTDRSPLDRFLMGVTISSLKTFYDRYLDLELHNLDVIPHGQPYILAANHSSHLDFGAILSALKSVNGSSEAKRLHTLGARDYFFDTQVKSWFWSSFLNVVPIEREETSLAGLRMVRRILLSGEPILIFPEGTRSRTGELQSFKPGLGLIAIEMNVPVIPVYIEGTYDSMPPGKALPRRRPVRVHFGDPILAEFYHGQTKTRPKDEVYRQLVSDVQDAVVKLIHDAETERAPQESGPPGSSASAQKSRR